MSQDPAADRPQNATPAPLLEGRFSLYATPDGGRMLCYLPDGAPDEDVQRIPIPAQFVAMMVSFSETGEMPSLRELMSMASPGGLLRMMRGK